MVKSAEGKLVVKCCISLLFVTVIYLLFYSKADFESVGRRFESCRAYHKNSSTYEIS